jgi:hypothetical protein
MKILRSIPLALFLLGVTSVALVAAAQTKALSEGQKTFLANYEPLRAALAADDLTKAKAAAKYLAATGDDKDAQAAAKKLSGAESLKDAREAFKAVSKRAVAVAAGQPGYFHAFCPMVPGNQGHWVQTSETIDNPYWGKAMLRCGTIEK